MSELISLLEFIKLKRIMPNLALDNYNKYIEHLLILCDKFEITTPERIAMFIAQLAQESGEFKYNIELGRTSYFAKYEPITNIGKSLGNTQTGDGAKFKGRGLIQLTGRENYRKFGEYCNYDFINDPSKVAEPYYAVLVACWYWDTRKINNYADQKDIIAATKKVNGGLNHIKERREYYARACEEYNIK